MQLKLDEETKPLTSFSTPMGQYEWNVLPFGLKQAPNIFQRTMDEVFKKYYNFCIVYIDDILIFTDKDKNDHLEKIKIIL